MKKYRSEDMKKAYAAAGYREKYAMEHGNKSIVFIPIYGKCYRFTYSRLDSYQDANGAMYSITRGAWIA